ncbi:MAG: hypothetical protein BRC22_02385 [Parcubacteria group bacterium QH_9_35_7]|nr:MAG: hypothetical protein BRC22_02385 [Parcubacteria group bacterium QH_9_35_7]
MSKNKGENPNFYFQVSTQEESESHFKKRETTPEWHNSSPEGELAIDVIDSKENLIIISTMAGAITDRVDINIHNDLLTIRGERSLPIDQKQKELEFHHQECYWGPFSRTIVLPVDAKAELAYAEYKNGILKIFIPKQNTDRDVPINIIEE